jgi:hypothetical protein
MVNTRINQRKEVLIARNIGARGLEGKLPNSSFRQGLVGILKTYDR